MKRVWIVRAERFSPNEDYDAERIAFEMVFQTRGDAHRVYHYGERKFNDNPSWRWYMESVLTDDTDFAIHSIDQLHEMEAEEEGEEE
jgi:hypothetical protein